MDLKVCFQIKFKMEFLFIFLELHLVNGTIKEGILEIFHQDFVPTSKLLKLIFSQ